MGARAPLALPLSLTLIAAACGAVRKQARSEHDRWQGRGGECVRALVGKSSPYRELPFDPVEDLLLDPLPPEARRTARAAGLERLIVAALRERRAA